MKLTPLISILSVLLSAQSSVAAPIQWQVGAGGNGHYYDFIQVADPFTGNNNAWTTAGAAAIASVVNGQNGYLATITSQAENDFVLNLVAGTFLQSEAAWLGGKDPEGWLDGPEAGQGFSYTNWGTFEPNNSGQLYMVIGTSSIYAPGKWADDSAPGGGGIGDGLPDIVKDPVIGYFVEYNAPVPEPSTFVLAALGLLGLGCVALRKKFRRA